MYPHVRCKVEYWEECRDNKSQYKSLRKDHFYIDNNELLHLLENLAEKYKPLATQEQKIADDFIKSHGWGYQGILVAQMRGCMLEFNSTYTRKLDDIKRALKILKEERAKRGQEAATK